MRDAMAIDDVKMPEPEEVYVGIYAYTADQMREFADAKCAVLRRRVAELEQSADLHYKSHAAAIAKLAESEKRVGELEADARRYRWLRDVHEHNIFVTRHVGAPTISRCFGEYLDSLIDKVFAIGAEGGEQ